MDSVTSTLIDQRLRKACHELVTRLREGETGVTEQLLAANPEFADNVDLGLELVYCEITTREEIGDRPRDDELCERFPAWRARIERLLEVHDAVSDADIPMAEKLVDTSLGIDRTDSSSRFRNFHRTGQSRPWIGSYELLEELGRGGNGVVYLARQVSLDRLVAVKLVHVDQAGRDQIGRFQAEAEAAARLQHPNIVQIHEVGEEDGFAYLSLELVDGGNLAQKISDTSLDPDTAARLMATIARAMEFAHQRGIIHRDLKPANILLTKTGEPKIADFGLAKRSWEHDRVKTKEGAIFGTPGYMAPEQALGNTNTVGPAADVYAMGAILYELLTGRAPFRGGGLLETLEQVRFLDPVPPRELRPRLSRDLETICLKCLHKQPESRYARAVDLAEDLERYLAREPIRARHITWVERSANWVRRRPAIASLAATIALMTVAGFAGIFWQWEKSEQRRAVLEKAFEDLKVAQAAEIKQREQLKGSLYLQRIAASYGEWLANNPEHAEQLLENCEPDRRGWEWHYLNRLMHAEHWTLKGHTLQVKGLAISPDGKWIASGSGNWADPTPGEVIVWDAATGEKRHVLRGHDGPIMDVAFSPDSQRIASAGGRWSKKGVVLLWDTLTGDQIGSLHSLAGTLMDVEFSADGKWIAAAGTSKLAQIWHADSLDEFRLIGGHQGAVFRSSFSPDSAKLVTCSLDSTVRLWDVQSGDLIASLVPGSDIRTVAFSPTGQLLAAASWNGIVKVWDISKCDTEAVRELAHHQLHSERVRGMEFSPDGQYLGVACSDGSVRLWHPIHGTAIRHFRAHSGTALSIAFHPQGHSVATSGVDRLVKYWDLAAEAGSTKFRGAETPIRALSLSNDGNRIALGCSARRDSGAFVNLWSLADRQLLHSLRGHSGMVRCVAFNASGDKLLSGSLDRHAILWDAHDGRKLQRFKGHTAAVADVDFLPDDQQVVTCSADHSIRFWNARTGETIATLAGHEGPVAAISVARQHRLLASASSDMSIRIWSISQCAPVAILRGHTGPVSDVHFSPDEKTIASCGKDARLLIWQQDESKPAGVAWTVKLEMQQQNSGNIQQIAFHPDGNRLVGLSDDCSITLWDMHTGEVTFSHRSGPETSIAGTVAFSPDGKRLISSYAESISIRGVEGDQPHVADPERIRIWHAETARACEKGQNWQGARWHYDRLIAFQPEEWMHHFRRGDSFARQQDWEQAEKAYADANALIAAAGTLTRSQQLNIVKQYCASALIQSQKERVPFADKILQQTIPYLEEILTESPNDSVALRTSALVAHQRGHLYRIVGGRECHRSFEEAVGIWEKLEKLGRFNKYDRVNLANSCVNLAVYLPHDQQERLYRRARQLLEPVVAAEPANQNFRVELALSLDDFSIWLERKGNAAEAEVLMNQALELRLQIVDENPTDPVSLEMLARSCNRLYMPPYDPNRTERARAVWRKFLTGCDAALTSKPPSDVTANEANGYAWSLITCPFPELRNPKASLQWGKVAVNLNPDSMAILNTLAAAHFRNEEWDTARAILKDVMARRNGGDSSDWIILAMIDWRAGDYAQARHWLEKSSAQLKEDQRPDAGLQRLYFEATQLVRPATEEHEAGM